MVRQAHQPLTTGSMQRPKPMRLISVYRQIAAACILVLIGVAIGARFKSSVEPQPTTYTHYQTQYGKSFVTLPDGTQVWLNARTTLKLSNRFNENERQVRIDGEALFEVAENQDIPFLVDMKDMQLTVHGTKFNVNAYESKPAATVSFSAGSVSLSATGCSDIRLEPGYSITYRYADKQLSTNASDELVSLWANNELRIEDKSLEETARLLESWFHLKIEVAPALKSTHYYTLTARDETPVELLAAMQKIGKFKYRISEQKILIY
jgi:ferric-dicitrate binding protein FerR (iron transport regulator)